MVTRTTCRLLAAVVVLLVALSSSAHAQTPTLMFTYTWTAPTTGSPVHHYEVQTSSDNGANWTTVAAPTTNSTTLSLAVLVTHVVRVRGVDASGRAGIYSPISDPNFPDPGAPSAPGKPTRTP